MIPSATHGDRDEVKKTIVLLWSVIGVILICLISIAAGVHYRADVKLRQQVAAYAHLIASNEKTIRALAVPASTVPGFDQEKEKRSLDSGHIAFANLNQVQHNQLSQEIFFPYYASLNLGSKFSAALMKDGNLVFRFPQANVIRGQGSINMMEQMRAGLTQGIIVEVDKVDVVEKMIAFEKFSGSKFYATAALPVDEAMANARQFAFGILLGIFALIAGGLVVTMLIVKKLGR